MFCWRGVIPNVIPDSILTPSLRVRIRRPRHAEETSAHDQPDPRPTPQGHRNHQRDRHLGIRPPRLARAALHHLWDPRLPLPRRPPQATRPLPQLDPQGRRQDRHPAPQRRTACPIRTLVPGPPAPTGTPGRTRSPRPGDHRERTTPGNRPETKNTGHLDVPRDRRQIGGIRGLRLTITGVNAKFKYGGNKTAEHRAEIAAALQARNGPMDATAVRRILGRLPEPTETSWAGRSGRTRVPGANEPGTPR